jgi:hypothetical protein
MTQAVGSWRGHPQRLLPAYHRGDLQHRHVRASRENIESRGTNGYRYYCSTYVKGQTYARVPVLGKVPR